MSESESQLSLQRAKSFAERLLAEPVTEDKLDLIKQELILRQEALRLREKEIDNAHEYTLKTLEANTSAKGHEWEDIKHERLYLQQLLNTSLRYILCVFTILIALISYALYLNKDQFVMEMAKALIFLLTGGIGGYSLQKLLPRRDDEAKKEAMAKKNGTEG